MQIEKDVRAKIEATLDICRRHYGKPIPTPTLKFKQAGRRAGYSQFNHFTQKGTLTINPDYFKNHYQDMIDRTVPHEVAHYVSDFIYGRASDVHGPVWASVMKVIGLPPTRCHNYSLEGVKTRKVARPYHYTCGCKDKVFHLTNQIHEKIQMGRWRKCLKCHNRIVYIGMDYNGQFVPSVKRTEPHITPTPARPVLVPVVKIEVPEPVQRFRYVTRLVGGILTNVKVPLTA